jgi:hypothetical protein
MEAFDIETEPPQNGLRLELGHTALEQRRCWLPQCEPAVTQLQDIAPEPEIEVEIICDP